MTANQARSGLLSQNLASPAWAQLPLNTLIRPEIQLETAPTDVGPYTVKIDVKEGDLYAAATDLTGADWNFTITEKTVVAPDEPSEPEDFNKSDWGDPKKFILASSITSTPNGTDERGSQRKWNDLASRSLMTRI